MGSNHHQKAQDNTTTQSCINQQQQQQQQQSPTSSPSHEFSFTISLHSNNTNTFLDKNKTNNNNNTPSSFAIDLTPADDIFFHGHLLPLHLLSHLPVSPRSSINSLDSFTLPITELPDEKNPTKTTTSASRTINSNKENTSTTPWNHRHHHHHTGQEQDKISGEKHGRVKSKSFSIFGIPRWKKPSDAREKEEKEKQKMRKSRFDVSHVVKRYMRMVRPLLSFKGGRREDDVGFGYGRQAYSFSGNNNNLSGWKSSKNNNRHELKGGGIRRGDFYSAPASMITSPSNSGLLVATPTAATPLPSNNDSTMEELQAAIQAAIAHCKNSIAREEKKLKAN